MGRQDEQPMFIDNIYSAIAELSRLTPMFLDVGELLSIIDIRESLTDIFLKTAPCDNYPEPFFVFRGGFVYDASKHMSLPIFGVCLEDKYDFSINDLANSLNDITSLRVLDYPEKHVPKKGTQHLSRQNTKIKPKIISAKKQFHRKVLPCNAY